MMLTINNNKLTSCSVCQTGYTSTDCTTGPDAAYVQGETACNCIQNNTSINFNNWNFSPFKYICTFCLEIAKVVNSFTSFTYNWQVNWSKFLLYLFLLDFLLISFRLCRRDWIWRLKSPEVFHSCFFVCVYCGFDLGISDQWPVMTTGHNNWINQCQE